MRKCVIPESPVTALFEVAKDGYEKIAKEAEKGIRAVKEKTGEGVDAIRDFIEKKKEEFQQKAEEKK
ncbi:MAG: hypothetical protein ACXW3H_09805 [Candidatus Aminicenantales bacterium]